MNLRWSWDQETRDLFRWVDPDLWEATRRRPGRRARQRWAASGSHGLADDPGFMRFLSDTEDELTRYLTNDRWFQLKGIVAAAARSPTSPPSSASPRRCRSTRAASACSPATTSRPSSDLGVPLVGVGLFYRHGYFRQSLSPTAGSRSATPTSIPYAMALTLCDGVRVERRPRRATAARPGVAGRRRPHAALPARRRHRRERARHARRSPTASTAATPSTGCARRSSSASAACALLEALGIDAQVFHTNEGHAGFLGLERIRRLIVDDGPRRSPRRSRRCGRRRIFTTHTPVPAGIDRFPRELMENYFATWAAECGVTLDELHGARPSPGRRARATSASTWR